MTSTEREIQSLVQQIMGMKRGNNFKPYINFIQFPLYRCFQEHLRVSFDFPLTVIVGQNGTGKTSLLHALSGAPRGSSPGTWWFGTALDPIDDSDGQGRRNLPPHSKAAFWYEYLDDTGAIKQTLKTRVKREGDPDYWEPSRPVKSYKMLGKERHLPVNMQAEYMNFKTQLNAFDRCFYFSADSKSLLAKIESSKAWQRLQASIPESRKRRPRIQDYLRAKAKKLRKVLVDGVVLKSGPNAMHRSVARLSSDELVEISRIIGRSYAAGALVEHRFYESWATSVLLDSHDLQYSEAFAGSGESAVARLVHEVSNSPDHRLLLLDEPETSLHPGAQLELVRYLLAKTAQKKLQVVISTHSPTIVRCLPPQAIRVFTLDSSGKVNGSKDVPADEAFVVLGHPPQNIIQLIVEDRLSKEIIEGVLATMASSFAARFDVSYRPGGESGMKMDAAIFMLDTARRVYFLFDGDKRDSIGPIATNVAVNVTISELDERIKNELNVRIKFRQNSNMSDAEKLDIRREFAEYVARRFHCLPYDTPEQAIWDDETARKAIELFAPDEDSSKVLKEVDAKSRFSKLATLFEAGGAQSTSFQILACQKQFIKKFCTSNSDQLAKLKAKLQEIATDADND